MLEHRRTETGVGNLHCGDRVFGAVRYRIEYFADVTHGIGSLEGVGELVAYIEANSDLPNPFFASSDEPFVLFMGDGRVLEALADVSSSTATLRPTGRGLHRP